jgi:pimeloyl-ACP methyl ester carboxylesterase
MITRMQFLGIATLITLGMAACGKKSAPVRDARTPPAARVDGAPQTVTSADGVDIAYRVYGAGEPAVVLIHCWSCDSSYWSAQIEPLKARYTTVTLDLAGHGASGLNRTDWSIGHFGEDVAAVARQLQNSRIVLVAHSMGGPVALEAARRIGDRVTGIVAVDTLQTVGLPPVSEREVQMRLKPFREDFIGHTREFVSHNFFPKDADPQFIRKISDDMSSAPPEVAVPSLEALMRMDYAPLLANVHVPVIAIDASNSGAVDEARIQKLLPAFKAVTIPDTGHFLMLETPERFNPILLREIESIAKGTHP